MQEQFAGFFTRPLWGIELWVYIAAFFAIFIGFLGRKIVALIIGHFITITRKTKFALDDVIFTALSKPAEWVVMVGGIYVALLILPLPRTPVDI